MYKNNIKKVDSVMDVGFAGDPSGMYGMSPLYDPGQLSGPPFPPSNNQTAQRKSPKGAKRGPATNSKKFLEEIQQLMPNYSFAADPIAAAAANVTMVMPQPTSIPFPTIPTSMAIPQIPAILSPGKPQKKTPVRPRKIASPKAAKPAKTPKKNGAAGKAKKARKPRVVKETKKKPTGPKTPRQSKKLKQQEDQVANFLANYSQVDTTTPEKIAGAPSFINGSAGTPPAPIVAPQAPAQPQQSVFNGINDVDLSTALILQSLSQRSFDSFHKKLDAQPEQWSPRQDGFGSPNRYGNLHGG
jgi:hypothetical protein